jgi:glycosyltransferase involved in cell wall biosynthesis
MAKRIRIGIIFSYEENWIGGTYYFLSIIQSLNYVEDSRKPEIVAFVNSDRDEKALREVQYPFLSIKHLSIGSRLLKRFDALIRRLTGQKIRPIEIWRNSLVDVVYLFRHDTKYFRGFKNKILWVADFQEFVLREYFSDEEFEHRSAVARYAAINGGSLVLSSEDSRRDFLKFFQDPKCQVHVVRFASIHPKFDHLDIEVLLHKYEIDRPYFICANQFWQHKNHITILKALLEIPERERQNFVVIFTGKNFDYRSKNYFDTLTEFIDEHKLGNTVKYIGFIPRDEQLCLMKHSISILQPSLFEGWSTTVEDAKQLNVRIILSDISVHKEQNPQNGFFFNRLDPKDLADKILYVFSNRPALKDIDYIENIRNFGNEFVHAIENSI